MAIPLLKKNSNWVKILGLVAAGARLPSPELNYASLIIFMCREIQLLMRRGQVETEIDNTEPLTKVNTYILINGTQGF